MARPQSDTALLYHCDNQAAGPSMHKVHNPYASEKERASHIDRWPVMNSISHTNPPPNSHFNDDVRLGEYSRASDSSEGANMTENRYESFSEDTCTTFAERYGGLQETSTTPALRQLMMMPSRYRLTTTIWEDQNTVCYQVDVDRICVARRQDNDMINGTKLLNIARMSRGKRDGILKNERGRVVVKVGAMHLKGVWIPFHSAKALAQRFKIYNSLHPLFVDNPNEYLYMSPIFPHPPYYYQQSPYQTNAVMPSNTAVANVHSRSNHDVDDAQHHANWLPPPRPSLPYHQEPRQNTFLSQQYQQNEVFRHDIPSSKVDLQNNARSTCTEYAPRQPLSSGYAAPTLHSHHREDTSTRMHHSIPGYDQRLRVSSQPFV